MMAPGVVTEADAAQGATPPPAASAVVNLAESDPQPTPMETDLNEDTQIATRDDTFKELFPLESKETSLRDRSEQQLSSLRQMQAVYSSGLHSSKQVKNLIDEHKMGRLPKGVSMPSASEIMQTVKGDRQLVRRLEFLRKCLTKDSAYSEAVTEFLQKHNLTLSSEKTGAQPLHVLAKKVRQYDHRSLDDTYIYKNMWPLFPIDSAVEFWSNLEEVSRVSREHTDSLLATNDPYATESSSGGDSEDEHCKLKEKESPLRKRKRKERPQKPIYSWIIAQLGDVDIKTRQLTQIQAFYRNKRKNPVILEPPIVEEDETLQCARTRALDRTTFTKRQLIDINNIHRATRKQRDKSILYKQSRVHCTCAPPLAPCLLCTGRNDPATVQPDPVNQPLLERFALLDQRYHQNLAAAADIPLDHKLEQALGSHLLSSRRKRKIATRDKAAKKPTVSAYLRRVAVGGGAGAVLASPTNVPTLRSRDVSRAGSMADAIGERLSRKGSAPLIDEERNSPLSKAAPSPKGPLTTRRPTLGQGTGQTSYEIDDIVIDPVAAVTRVERLPQVEIATRGWRRLEEEADAANPLDEEGMSLADIEECLDELIYYNRHETLEKTEKTRSATYREWVNQRPSVPPTPATPAAVPATPYAPRTFSD